MTMTSAASNSALLADVMFTDDGGAVNPAGQPVPLGTHQRPAARDHRELFAGRIFDVVGETVDLGAAGTVYREYSEHPGAVAVVALDAEGRVAVVDQYRHPVRSVLWEIPAGLLDVAGEPPLAAARRELAEEADLAAATWHVLADIFSSPGGTNEALRIYLARDLAPTPHRFARVDEEAAMQVTWVPLDTLVDSVLAGQVQDASAVVGALAAHAARAASWEPLRPADAPWQARPTGGPARA